MNDLDQATSSQLEEKIVQSTEEMSKIVESLVPVQKIPDLCINFVKNIFDDTRDTTQYLFLWYFFCFIETFTEKNADIADKFSSHRRTPKLEKNLRYREIIRRYLTDLVRR